MSTTESSEHSILGGLDKSGDQNAESFESLIRKLTQIDPMKRPSAKKALQILRKI